MAKVTFDTNIFISRPDLQLPNNFYLSVVVLQELVAGADDESALKDLDAARLEHEKAGRLLVPNAEDWWLVGKIINALQRGLKSNNRGLTPKMAADEEE